MGTPTNFQEFWPFYLSEHSRPATRFFHFVGTSFGLLCLGTALVKQDPLWLPIGLVGSYGLAWFSHFFIEKNRPATFQYPVWSFLGDFKMYGQMWCGKLWR
ncbi:MAG: DUF962 domain-containing protein [Bdellovibrionota bacterium]